MIRWRTSADGSIWIPRPDPTTEEFLDRTCLRWPGELRWSPKPKDSSNLGAITDLDGRFKGQSAVVFGKGPSLQRFLSEDMHLADIPLRICLNETCLIIPHPHFAFFVDPHNAHKIQFPPRCNIVCPPAMVSRIVYPNGNRILTFTRGDDITPAYATAAIALTALCRWGVDRILLVGFDAFDMTVEEQKNGVAYAQVIDAVCTKERDSAYYEPINRQLKEVIDRLTSKGAQVDFYHRTVS